MRSQKVGPPWPAPPTSHVLSVNRSRRSLPRGVELVVGVAHSVRQAHSPRLDEQLSQFVNVDRIETDLHPSVPHV
jgi:hypothetical protein